MRFTRLLPVTTAVFLTLEIVPFSLLEGPTPNVAYAASARDIGVGPQYDTTHVYVARRISTVSSPASWRPSAGPPPSKESSL
jgi:hypothetical protein